jgi:hypothetical protein
MALALIGTVAGQSQDIHNEQVTVRAVQEASAWTGFEVLHHGQNVATVRLSSGGLLTATRCTAEGATLTFAGLTSKPGAGVQLGAADTVQVTLKPGDPFPVVFFDLNFRGFDTNAWLGVAGKQPFHFLALYLPEAEVWHQRGWLNATPLADPFPLLQDTHVGTPEISAYHYNPTWSYTMPLGAHPLPVIGLWAPRVKRYVAFEFQTTRLRDNSEKDVATGYHWAAETNQPARLAQAEQFVALVYPYGGQGYQSLVLPKAGDHLASRGVLLWSTNLAATDDPNRFVYDYLWSRAGARLPRVPEVPDLSWLPGGCRLRDFEGPPGVTLIGGVEGQFQVPGSKVLGGWRWHNESPTAAAKARGDTRRLAALEAEAQRLLGYAKRWRVGADPCVFWEKPLAGAWTPQWGGPPATTLHNANGFAAGRLFLGLYRDCGKTNYLEVVDGVFNWAKHVVWTRNEFADVPSSPFAIGGTLTASFCLDYYSTFENAPDEARRAAARQALDLARSFTYRYLAMWPSDNNRADNLDPAFLWEPNSGRDWTGAACANEVFWNLDTLAQTAVHTGDPVLLWALRGSLERWPQLYQERYKDSLADYQPADMTEGYGLYAGNVYGVGQRAGYGFASTLPMIEPVGNSLVRVLAGEKAALLFNKHGRHTRLERYACTASGDFAFTLLSQTNGIDVSVTFPYADLSAKPVFLLRDGKRLLLEQEKDFTRPPQALWSLYLKSLNNGDRVIVGESAKDSPPIQIAELPVGDVIETDNPFLRMGLACDRPVDENWDHLDSWAGLPRGGLWAYGVNFVLRPAGQPCVLTMPGRLTEPVQAGECVALLYSAGSGARPKLVCADGEELAVDPQAEALAWRAWPPIYTARLVAALVPARGKTITAIDPGDRLLWAASAARAGLPAAQLNAVLAQFKDGAAAWQRFQLEEQQIASLKTDLTTVPQGSVAILPPNPAGAAMNLGARSGLLKRAVSLTPQQMVDQAQFNAKRFPVALYAGGEDFIHTVRASGDGADALVRYVQQGGALLLLSAQPWPMCYATGPGFRRSDPLTPRLGLPLVVAVEQPPADTLTVQLAAGQAVLTGLPAQFRYPPGDPRLRSIARAQIPAGVKYSPLCRITGAQKPDYGDAAGLLEFPAGGKILYVWSGLLNDPDYGSGISQAVLRFLAHAAQPK